MQDNEVGLVARKSIHGIIALVSRSFFLQAISYIASLFIWTYLAQGEYGVYIVVTAMQRVISFFTDFGVGAALIQKKTELKQEDLITSFTLQALLTLVIFIIVFLFQDALASYFKLGVPAMRLLLVLVFTIFISSFKVIPSILLEREIKFHTLIIPQIVESLIFNILLIILVVKGFGISSYTYAFLSASLSSIPFYYYISPWKIRFGIDRESLRHLKFGLQYQAKNILATLKDDFLVLFLAKILTFKELDYVGFAQRNAFFAYRYVVDSTTKVTFSTYSRIQGDMYVLKKSIEKSLFFVSLFMSPIVFGLILISPYIIHFFPKWSNKWEPAIVSLIFFSLNALVSSFSGILVNVLDATGRVKTTLKLMVLWTILTWVLTALFIAWFGFNGVAIASFLVTLTIVITVYLVKKIVSFSFWGSIYKPFIAATVMGIITFILTKTIVSDLFSLGMVIIIAGVCYSGIMYMMAYKEVKSGIELVFKKHA